MNCEAVKKVHVVYKTHLDLGFTGLAREVLEKYRHEFIPRALDTAEQLNQNGARRFIWTTGSWLIDDYLTNMPEAEAARLDAAIRRGDIVWHALAYTTHSELMDETLMDYNLSISRKLCARFGKQICAAKLSDVPGHTIAMVPALAKAGVKYMHIGINGASRIVSVPPLFRWRFHEDEILVDYAAHYGAVSWIEGCDEVMEFNHTKDNMGPPTVSDVEAFLARMHEKYPNALIEASTMDAFYQAIAPFRCRLPLITDEIGDTWIHGIGTDPYKVSAMRRLLAKRQDWIARGVLTPDTAEDRQFLDALLRITEHTWGMDIKKFLYDFKNWERRDFEAARARDRTGLPELQAGGALLQAALEKEHQKYTGGRLIGSYSLFAQSHQEQRDYLQAAVHALPMNLKPEAEAAIALPAFAPFVRTAGRTDTFQIQGAAVHVESDGALTVRGYDGAYRTLGRFCYEVFDWQTVNRCYLTYNRAFEKTRGWAEADFSKPGLQAVPNLARTCWSPSLVCTERPSADQLRIVCEVTGEAVQRFGCPREIEFNWQFTPMELRLTMRWRDKAANRIPEALWLGFDLPQSSPGSLTLRKIGQAIDPFSVVPGGARKLHACEGVWIGHAPAIVNWDAPLVSLGSRALYEVADDGPMDADQAQFLLFNNRWGTNFKMWYEEDAEFRFTVKR